MNTPIFRSFPTFATVLAAAFLAAPVHGATTPPKIIQTVEPMFPISLEHSLIPEGYAVVMLSIAADGTLADSMVTEYSHRAFGEEALAVLKEWKYEPATIDGNPIGARVSLRINFSTSTRVMDLYAVDTPSALIGKPGQYEKRNRIVSARELDEPIRVLNAPVPKHPEHKSDIQKGLTLVEFYVDTEGHPRLPVILKSTDPAFAEAAIRALSEWRFSVPTRDGEPVIVRTRQEFVFSNGT